jgi:monovalent cation/proton antiporter MnhG/PhaG subunit
MGRAVVAFAAYFGFWWLLSDRYTGLSLGLAAASAALVTWANGGRDVVSDLLRAGPRFALYVPWLLKEIAVANVRVARLVLDPRLPIDPVVVRVSALAGDDVPLTVLGNSITLTPGTVTLDVEGSALVVHALTRESAADLAAGTMARRVDGRVAARRRRLRSARPVRGHQRGLRPAELRGLAGGRLVLRAHREPPVTIVLAVLLAAGLFFHVVAALGVLRMPDFYTRLHAVSEAETLGMVLVVVGLAVWAGPGLTAVKLLLVAVFLLLANPTSTHALGRAALRIGLRPWGRQPAGRE